MEAEKFVQNVKNACAKRSIQPTPCCYNAGVGKSFLSDIKRGRVPSIDAVQALARYLGVPTSELLGEPLPLADGLSDADRELLDAFHRADGNTQELIRVALRPYDSKTGKKTG